MNNDNGYSKAQREYDNQLPPSDNTEDCLDCEGAGVIEIEEDGNLVEIPCDTCDGTGQIDIEESKREAYEEWLENKADEARYEQSQDQKIGSDIDKFTDKHIEE